MPEERQVATTGETVVYILAVYILIAATLGRFNAGLHPFALLGLSMAVVYLFMRYRLEARVVRLLRTRVFDSE